MTETTKKRQVLEYFIKTLNGMAKGLFATFIIGVIVEQVAIAFDSHHLFELADILKSFLGVGIGVGVAHSLGLKDLKLVGGAVAGGIATAIMFDPVVAYLTAIAAIEAMRWILRKKTPIDIILIPLFAGATAYATAMLIGEPVAFGMTQIGNFIEQATTYQPFLMGIVIAVVMGMILTSPVSSAAIGFSIGLSGIAAGAAVAGGAAQMVGFAVMARKDNNIGTVLSTAFGTSMLQFKNVLKKPVIWLPPIIASAILGPLATVALRMESTPVASGMGTSGLVGPIGVLDAMGHEANVFVIIGILCFAGPVLLVFAIELIMRMKGFIGAGDFKLD